MNLYYARFIIHSVCGILSLMPLMLKGRVRFLFNDINIVNNQWCSDVPLPVFFLSEMLSLLKHIFVTLHIFQVIFLDSFSISLQFYMRVMTKGNRIFLGNLGTGMRKIEQYHSCPWIETGNVLSCVFIRGQENQKGALLLVSYMRLPTVGWPWVWYQNVSLKPVLLVKSFRIGTLNHNDKNYASYLTKILQ